MYGNPYYNPTQRYQPMPTPTMTSQPITTQPYIQPVQQPTNPVGLLGKSVDSIDVVKAMDIPLDGSVSYFPLTDGSAIVTKQLQVDGTSKTIIYKPIEEQAKEMPKYVTIEDVKREIEKIDLSELDDLKDELKDIKKQLKVRKNKED